MVSHTRNSVTPSCRPTTSRSYSRGTIVSCNWGAVISGATLQVGAIMLGGSTGCQYLG